MSAVSSAQHAQGHRHLHTACCPPAGQSDAHVRAVVGGPLLRLVRAWLAYFRSAIFRLHGATPLLATALAGFIVSLGAGSLQGAGYADAVGVAHCFVFCFLFPLVSGAAGQLLPLWLRPGPQTQWHAQARMRLTYGAGIRALLFLAAGLLALARIKWAALLALAALLPFAIAAFSLLREKRRS